MPWHIPNLMSQRLEFVLLARQPGVNFRELCARFGVSAKTGYKWSRRHAEAGSEGLLDQSRRPKRSPRQCSEAMAAEVLALYKQWGWGGRKIRRRLQDLGLAEVPAASTCTAVLHRAGAFAGREAPAARPLQRFRRDSPNALWQMDFKGDFATQSRARCYPPPGPAVHRRFHPLLPP